jgi:hypothetical protein
LAQSIKAKETSRLVGCLPDEVVNEIEEILMRHRADDYMLDTADDERHIEEESK